MDQVNGSTPTAHPLDRTGSQNINCAGASLQVGDMVDSPTRLYQWCVESEALDREERLLVLMDRHGHVWSVYRAADAEYWMSGYRTKDDSNAYYCIVKPCRVPVEKAGKKLPLHWPMAVLVLPDQVDQVRPLLWRHTTSLFTNLRERHGMDALKAYMSRNHIPGEGCPTCGAPLFQNWDETTKCAVCS